MVRSFLAPLRAASALLAPLGATATLLWTVLTEPFARLGVRRVHVGAGLLALTIGAGAATAHSGLLSDVLSPEAAARAAMAEARAQRERETNAFTSALVTRQEQTLEIARGESLALVLARANVPWADVNQAVEAVSGVVDPRRMRPGQSIQVFYEPEGDVAQLTGLAFRTDPSATISVSRSMDGAFHAREIQTPWRMETAHVVAKISGSLYQSAIDAGATEREVAAISDVFSYDIDFQRDIFPGDTFELLFERFFDDEGRTIRTGDLNFVSLSTRRGPRAYYFFRAPGDAEGGWYDSEGRSARKFLMKTPIDGARLTSRFGMRTHPILGYSRMHKGVDFAARTGTPIRAAGDGVVAKAGWFGGFGKYIRLRHGDSYDTAYGHLSNFASGIRAGARVRQGQIIGYVGTTGNSTGPHLHYEVLQFNRQVNPIKLKFTTGRNLDAKMVEAFKVERDRIDALRSGGPALVATASAGLSGGLRGELE